ncbi:hypothetical protein Pla52o_19620 [Novipirellula galeiformis]|uniref:Uncharacterized protein n=1 Tax=Novipirellula galeiformis TaxID=2528004 RepID=A0A5C6CMM2_9BACT|nr:hypothetical protein Pla52o_19620 [Novipirellula galeiformis]
MTGKVHMGGFALLWKSGKTRVSFSIQLNLSTRSQWDNRCNRSGPVPLAKGIVLAKGSGIAYVPHILIPHIKPTRRLATFEPGILLEIFIFEE